MTSSKPRGGLERAMGFTPLILAGAIALYNSGCVPLMTGAGYGIGQEIGRDMVNESHGISRDNTLEASNVVKKRFNTQTFGDTLFTMERGPRETLDGNPGEIATYSSGEKVRYRVDTSYPMVNPMETVTDSRGRIIGAPETVEGSTRAVTSEINTGNLSPGRYSVRCTAIGKGNKNSDYEFVGGMNFEVKGYNSNEQTPRKDFKLERNTSTAESVSL